MIGTVFAAALNHKSQFEAWRPTFQQPPYQTPPKTPVWFIKPRNTVSECGAAIPHPEGEKVFSGATLAVVIGKIARKVTAEEALRYVCGYALANEVSLPEEHFYRPAIKAKCRDGFCPIGATGVPAAPHQLNVITEINGVECDRWNTVDLIRSAPELISAISEFITLQPGDIILLGTPQNRVALQPGDTVLIKAEGLPSLENHVVSEEKK